jgi:hypothetical protein
MVVRGPAANRPQTSGMHDLFDPSVRKSGFCHLQLSRICDRADSC